MLTYPARDELELAHAQGEPSVFVSEAADLAGRASERPRGTKNARQIAGRDYEHSSTCQARRQQHNDPPSTALLKTAIL